jgi:CRISPR-associated endonuclease/helicase Cas3
MSQFFDERFQQLTGDPPLPWQRRLYNLFVDKDKDDYERFPPGSLPTRLGKTSVMAVWLLALGARPPIVESLMEFHQA